MEFIGVIIFFVVVVLSMIQRFKEQRALSAKLEREDAEEDARGFSAADEVAVPTAQPRGAARRRAQAEIPQDMEDIIRQLMGQPPKSARADEDDEGEWEAAPPPLRREMPQRTQQPAQTRPEPRVQPPRRPAAQQQPAQPQSARPVRQRPARSPQEMMGTRQARPRQQQPQMSQADIERREREKQWKLEQEQRKKREQAARQRGQAGAPTRRVARTHRRQLFGDLGEVRRAIVLAEVINPPRSLNDLEPRV